MYIIDKKFRDQFVAALATKQRSKSYAHELPARFIQNSDDVLLACQNVYDSGIIFQQGGAAAKRNGTPNIDSILADLANKIYGYFANTENATISQAAFDWFHADCCVSFLSALNAARASVHLVELYYGSAQKMVNMVFKYLACYQDYIAFAQHFKWCHMPIDTVILKWLCDRYTIGDIEYYEYTDAKGNINLSAKYKGHVWTKLDTQLYEELVKLTRKKISADPLFKDQTILGVEAAIW